MSDAQGCLAQCGELDVKSDVALCIAVKASGKTVQYEIVPQEEWLERFPYDKRSVMHYRRDNRMRARTEVHYNYIRTMYSECQGHW